MPQPVSDVPVVIATQEVTVKLLNADEEKKAAQLEVVEQDYDAASLC